MQEQGTIPTRLASIADAVTRKLRDQLQGVWAPEPIKLFCVGMTFLPDLPNLLGRPEVPWSRYLRRSSEIDLLAMTEPAVLMVRLPSIAFFVELESGESGHETSALDRFAIQPEGGVMDLSVASHLPPPWALEFVVRASRVDAAWDTLSPTQEARMQARRTGQLHDIVATQAGVAALLDVLRAEGIDPLVALEGPCFCGSVNPFGTCHGGALRRALAR